MNNLKNLGQDQIQLKCEICDKDFKNSKGLKYHFKFIHTLEKEYVFKLQSQLNVHMKIVHEKKKLYKCDSYEKAFSIAGNLKTHMNTVHNGQKDHKCDSCGKVRGDAKKTGLTFIHIA